MCYAAPGIIYLFDRMGVTFNRTAEGLLDFRRFGGTLPPPHRVRGRHDRPAAAVRARRAGAPSRSHRPRDEVRRLGVRRRREGRRGPLRRLTALDLRTMKAKGVQGRRGHARDRRTGPALRPVHEQPHQLRLRRGRRLHGRRALRQRRVHPDPPDGHPRRRQAPPHERVRARRRRPRVGAAPPGRQSRAAPDSRAERFYFLEEKYPSTTQPRAARRREPRDPQRVREPRSRRGRQDVRLPRPHAHPARDAQEEARRHPRDLRSSRATIRATSR